MTTEGLPGGCNPADVLNKLATARGIRPPHFELVSTVKSSRAYKYCPVLALWCVYFSNNFAEKLH
jgi:hypothetical protein